ncbi:MAG: phosphate-starvation-inducible PsiE family protein [Gemmatimonadota bacterium]
MVKEQPREWKAVRREWPILTVYQRFEAIVTVVLTVIVSAVILVALYRLLVSVADTLVLRALNPLDHDVFQNVFGAIMTLLIALEFNHTLQYAVAGGRGIIQTRIVLVIAMLALARKIIVMELTNLEPASVAALAALTLALGVTYWLIRDRDTHPEGGSGN